MPKTYLFPLETNNLSLVCLLPKPTYFPWIIMFIVFGCYSPSPILSIDSKTDVKLRLVDRLSRCCRLCAGDAYRYTIQPVFQNIKTEFQCHVKHQKYDVLYELFYFIQIPGRGFQTPKVYKTVYARDLAYESHGEYVVRSATSLIPLIHSVFQTLRRNRVADDKPIVHSILFHYYFILIIIDYCYLIISSLFAHTIMSTNG